jgi:predicted nucleotide-binding protein
VADKQQVVVHLYAPADGPHAPEAYSFLREVWHGCRMRFQMTDRIPGIGLPSHLPDTLADFLRTITADGETAVAAQEQHGTECQAILRRNHDVINMSVALAPGTWAQLDGEWEAIAAPGTGLLLGEVRLFLMLMDHPDVPPAASTAVGRRLGDLLPSTPVAEHWWDRGITVSGDIAVWEVSPREDTRTVRRFVIAADRADDADLSGWLWSRGDTAMPPLARYLLHAAKLRYLLRIWQRDGGALTEGLGDDETRTRLAATELRELRLTAEIAEDNMRRLLTDPALTAAGGPFHDDLDVARVLLARLDDALRYLSVDADRTALRRPPSPGPTRMAPAETGSGADVSRNVFVVHGRDEEVRLGMFNFLRALHLRPMEWENLVSVTGNATPYLGEVVTRGLARTQAAVVMLTPDDIVRLHPSLCTPSDDRTETEFVLQPRPNVLLELGIALAFHPRRTVVVLVGELRPVADLGGLNYIRLGDTPDWRLKVATRLEQAGCPVERGGQDWLTAGPLTDLAAHRRKPRE